MVSKKDLKDYNFETIDQYFEYIIESLINGQKNQVKELYLDLSQKQKNNFLIYCYDFTFLKEFSEILRLASC